MKKSSLIMMIVGICLSVAGIACLTICYWDKITDAYGSLRRKAVRPKEYDDFADLDEDLLY